MSATLDFITSGSATTYTVVDTTTGATNPPYSGKEVQIVALDGTYLYDTGAISGLGTTVFTVPITADWTTHLGIVQIVVTLNYYNGNSTESVSHTYTLPTSLNIKTS